MLVNLAQILGPAVNASYGVAAFNIFGWEEAQAVVEAAEECNAPVILSANLDFSRSMPVEIIAQMFRTAAEAARVPVCAHLDHTYEIHAVLRAVDAGFTSVMYDGSQLPIEDNIAGTRQITAYAHRAGCSVEAEIGSVPYSEGRDHIRSAPTDVSEAEQLTVESGRCACHFHRQHPSPEVPRRNDRLCSARGNTSCGPGSTGDPRHIRDP